MGQRRRGGRCLPQRRARRDDIANDTRDSRGSGVPGERSHRDGTVARSSDLGRTCRSARRALPGRGRVHARLRVDRLRRGFRRSLERDGRRRNPGPHARGGTAGEQSGVDARAVRVRGPAARAGVHGSHPAGAHRRRGGRFDLLQHPVRIRECRPAGDVRPHTSALGHGVQGPEVLRVSRRGTARVRAARE